MLKEEKLDPKAIGQKDDWQGNNAAFTCRVCGRVFIVSEHIHVGRRFCECGHSEGFVTGGRKSGGSAWIAWDEEKEVRVARTLS